jgi:nucleoside-diphosphate-sugar epimerase
LTRSDWWQGLIEPGCQFVNLVYARGKSEDENLMAVRRLADACRLQGARRLIHCSTAVVAGRVRDDLITEQTACEPVTPYEKNKWNIESILLKEKQGNPEVIVLRPTAVFGTGGHNLVGLIENLLQRPRLYNYLKSCLYDRRAMNMVSVHTLVEAIIFFVMSVRSFHREVFIVSDDEYPENNFRAIERQLMSILKVSDYRRKRMVLPPYFLAVLLLLSGRSCTNPQRRYSCKKLLGCGFRKGRSFTADLTDFARTFARPAFA